MNGTPAQTSGTIRLRIFDGRRQPVADDQSMLVRVLDGRKQQVAAKFVQGPVIPVLGLPFHDSPDDGYTVIVHADGCEDAAIYPVRLQAGRLVDACLMLMPKDGLFHFAPFDTVRADPLLYCLVANGAAGDIAARYHTAVENQPMQLGALLTIGTAIRDIPLDDLTSPLAYYWEVVWDLMAQDRFYAWVDARLAGRIEKLAALHSFAGERDAAHYHPGVPGRVRPATRSWKQTRFDVSNVQLTFHEDNTRTIPTPDGPLDCVLVEPDMDYYKDLLAHGLLEVLPHAITGNQSDPRQDYCLRWTATRLEGVQPDFEPPVTVE
jgi:hypothetical protein